MKLNIQKTKIMASGPITSWQIDGETVETVTEFIFLGSQIIPPSPSPTESKRLLYTSVSLLLSHIQGYCYHLSKFHIYALIYCSFSSVTQLGPTLCDPMNRSTPGLLVHHQLLEFTQIHVHRVLDAIQPSHPWSSPSPPAPNPSQHQSLFQ